MITSLALAAWCKGELENITPDIAITHNDKKGFTEGYGISLGLRVRI
jgi:hypothetical protein